MQNCYLKTVFPKIDDALENDIFQFDVANFLIRIEQAYRTNDINLKKSIIAEYNDFMAKCETVENQISMYINSPKAARNRNIGTAKFDLPSVLAKLKSQPAYKAAENWTWDISQGARYYERIVQALADTNYKNDKNVFLYNLQNLDETCKKEIADAYGYVYINLPNIPQIYATRDVDDVTLVNRQKFVNVVQSFCVEVLLNCCPTPPNISGVGKTVDQIITQFIKKTIPLKSVPSPTENIILDDNNYYAFISEVNIINENYKVINKTAETINSVDIENSSGEYQELETRVDDGIPAITYEPSLQAQMGGAIPSYKFAPSPLHSTDKVVNLIVEQEPSQTIGPLLNMHLAHNIGSASSFHLIGGLGTRTATLSTPINVTVGALDWATRGVTSNVLQQVGWLFIINEDEYQSYLDELDLRQAQAEQSRPGFFSTGEFTMSPADNFLREADPNLLNLSSRERIFGRNEEPPQAGGSSESDLTAIKSDDNSISENTKTLPDDILTDNSICFHPSLPLYMMANAYLSFAENDDIEDSMEYELCIKYFKFIKKCQKQLALSYSNENNSTENKLKAYIIGIGLKQLFFIANVDEKEGYEKCYEALDMTESEYYPLASLSSTISYMSSGRIFQSDEERTIGLRILESPIFKDYITSVNPRQIFDEPLSSIELVNKKILLFKAKSFIIETGRKIVADRTGEPISPVEASGEGIGRPIATETPISVKVDSGNAQGVVPQKPFDYRTLDQGPRDAFGQATTFGAPISVGASGGKKKHKNTRNAKRANKTHKHRNKKGGKRTRKHKKNHKKKFTRKHKK
jgi:hypothetical protein